jgi:hypothetical protein
MPSYTYHDTKKNEDATLSMSISEMEKFEKNNPHMQRIYNIMNIVDPAGIGVSKPPTDFSKHVLGRIKANNPQSVIGSGRWSIPKEI